MSTPTTGDPELQDGAISSAPTSPAAGPHLGILYENDAWLGDLRAALDDRALPHVAHDLCDAAFHLATPADATLYFNRASPSAHLRDHRQALRYVTAWMEAVEDRGVKVINGSRAFRLETSKVAQHLLLDRLGLATPATLVFNGRDAVRRIVDDFPFPAILKPDTGGSGAHVRWVESRTHLDWLLDEERDLFGPDQLLLLQQYVPTDAGVLRLELVDGELLFAMRVEATNTFNLCPAVGCERLPAEGPQRGARPGVTFTHVPDVPADAVAQAREVVRAAGLDVGGVESIEHRGERWYFDINATSVYRPDICEAAGVDASSRLVDYLERELVKESSKARRAAVRGARHG